MATDTINDILAEITADLEDAVTRIEEIISLLEDRELNDLADDLDSALTLITTTLKNLE